MVFFKYLKTKILDERTNSLKDFLSKFKEDWLNKIKDKIGF